MAGFHASLLTPPKALFDSLKTFTQQRNSRRIFFKIKQQTVKKNNLIKYEYLLPIF